MINNILGSLLTNCNVGITPKIIVFGSSMKPMLLNGDSIDIVQSNEYLIGDIVVFEYDENEYIVHRVVYKDKEKLVCKGDNSFRLEYIKHTNILGKVMQVVRNGNIVSLRVMAHKYIDMSYRIGLLTLNNKYNMKQVILNDLYKRYYYEYLKAEKYD